MARIRSIKPPFFTNEKIADLPPLVRILFIGLWTEADREGRLEDRPRRLKTAILPYDAIDVNGALDQLADADFIERYEADGQRCIQITKFLKHQRPHHKEPPSELPPPPDLDPCIAAGCIDDHEADHAQAMLEASMDDARPIDAPRQSLDDPQIRIRIREGKGREGSAEGARARDPADVVVLGDMALGPRSLGPPPIDPQAILSKFGRIRSEVVGGLPWHAAGRSLYAKADQLAQSLRDDPTAVEDIEPTMRLLLADAKESQDPRDRDIGWSFGVWVHRFTDLRERLHGLRKGPKSASDVPCDFHRGGRNQGKRAPKSTACRECAECRHLHARDSPRPASDSASIGDLLQAR